MNQEMVTVADLEPGDLITMCDERGTILALGLVMYVLPHEDRRFVDVAIKQPGVEIGTQRYDIALDHTIGRVKQ